MQKVHGYFCYQIVLLFLKKLPLSVSIWFQVLFRSAAYRIGDAMQLLSISPFPHGTFSLSDTKSGFYFEEGPPFFKQTCEIRPTCDLK